MKILITGGCGFIGSHVAERFIKEGHEVCIIDDLSTSARNNIEGQFNFYQLNVADKKCEDVFRNNNFDIVIHLAARGIDKSAGDAYLDCEANVSGLVNLLGLSRNYNVKKFIFISSAVVYGEPDMLPISEDTPVKPLSIHGVNKATAEFYCEQWRKLYGLQTIILRVADIYGPRQGMNGEAGIVAALIKQMFSGEDLSVHGDGNQTRDYVYVEDVVDAVYKAVEGAVSADILNISTNTENSLNGLIRMLGQLGTVKGIKHVEKREGDILKSRLDNTKAMRELGWKPKYTLEEGLFKTYRWFQAHRNRQDVADEESEKAISIAKIKPYLENIALFIVMASFSYVTAAGGFLDFKLGLDYNYIYIAIMGLMYGKKQSLLATVLSSIIFIGYMSSRGADFISLIYQAQYLTHFATYLCIGVVSGYVTDNRERKAADLNLEKDSLTERYEFLQKMYMECIKIKDELYSQIVNSDDSIGKIYGIVRELDSLRAEDVYTATVTVVGKIMKSKAVDIYTVNKDNSYWRLKVRADSKACSLPNSVKIADYEYAQIVMQTEDIYVNRSLNPSAPSMAVPIVNHGRIIAIVQIYNLPFESMTLYHINLFKITAMLISDALTKAHLYDQDLQDKKYIEGTGILVAEEFEKIQAVIKKRKELFKQDISILRLTDKSSEYEKIYKSLSRVIRAEDYIGLKEDGYVYILLLNISANMVLEVKKRLEHNGIFTVDVSEEYHVIH